MVIWMCAYISVVLKNKTWDHVHYMTIKQQLPAAIIKPNKLLPWSYLLFFSAVIKLVRELLISNMHNKFEQAT